MLNDWSDRMSAREADEHWRRQVDAEVKRRTARLERELREAVERQGALPTGFYEAMGHFLTLRDKLFPGLPADPAWKILVTLAQTEQGSDKASVSGIAYGAEVPLTTALRYLAALELQGIVERVPHPSDKRQVIIRLTDEGRRRLDTIAERWAIRALWWAALPLALLAFAAQAIAG